MKQANWPLTRTPHRRRPAFVSLLTAIALTVIGLVTTVTPPQAIAATTSGMTLAEAQDWVNAYKTMPAPRAVDTWVTPYNIYDAGCSGGPLANCVALSEYFVNRYTTVPDWKNTTNGNGVVAKLESTYGWPTGTAPQVYSIFSNSGPSSYGHTGVVLGMNSDGSFQIAEASCTNQWIRARTITLAEMRNAYGTTTFVYPPASQLTGLPATTSSVSGTNLMTIDSDGNGIGDALDFATQTDVNKDGYPDIVGFADEGVVISLNNAGKGFGTPSYWVYAFGPSAKTGGWAVDKNPRMVIDINKDGYPDIVGFANDGVVVSLNNAGKSFGTPTFWLNAYGASPNIGAWGVNKNPRTLIDVNKDGYPDIVGIADEGVVISLNNAGKGFGTPSYWVYAFGPSAKTGGWAVDKNPRYIG